jgi:hypothetical protein
VLLDACDNDELMKQYYDTTIPKPSLVEKHIEEFNEAIVHNEEILANKAKFIRFGLYFVQFGIVLNIIFISVLFWAFF